MRKDLAVIQMWQFGQSKPFLKLIQYVLRVVSSSQKHCSFHVWTVEWYQQGSLRWMLVTCLLWGTPGIWFRTAATSSTKQRRLNRPPLNWHALSTISDMWWSVVIPTAKYAGSLIFQCISLILHNYIWFEGTEELTEKWHFIRRWTFFTVFAMKRCRRRKTDEYLRWRHGYALTLNPR